MLNVCCTLGVMRMMVMVALPMYGSAAESCAVNGDEGGCAFVLNGGRLLRSRCMLTMTGKWGGACASCCSC